LLWLAVGLFANQAIQLVDLHSYAAFAASLATQNYIYWLACFAVVYRLYLSDGAARATRLDLFLAVASAAAILLSSFLPYRFAIGLLATVLAGYILITHTGDRNLKAAGAILLALSGQLVWGPIIFQFFTPELLRADAAIVGEALTSLRPDIVWTGTSFVGADGHSIALVGACSSFNNVSTAVLACATVAMLTRTEWCRRDLAAIAVACVAMVLINAGRICLLAWSGSSYQFWHDGAGVQILGIAETLVVLMIAWWGAASKRRAP
jgi:exosortase/archaeosortase family protein